MNSATKTVKILIPVDGSDNALRAVGYAAKIASESGSLKFELLNVLLPMPLRAHAALAQNEIDLMYTDEAKRVLLPAQHLLDLAGLSYSAHYRVGHPATEIAAQVIEKNCDAVIMGTRGLGFLGRAVNGSVAARVVHLVGVPVTLIK
jgi:nucleotide-binding universal stress UspA family protein